MKLLNHIGVLFLIFGGTSKPFHSGCTNEQYHRLCTSVFFFSPHPHQYLLFVIFSMKAILTGVRQYLTVVFICISLMTRDGKHFLTHLLALCMSSLGKCLFEILCPFLNWVVCCIDFFFFFVFCLLSLLGRKFPGQELTQEVPRLGVESELQLPPTPQPQQREIQAESMNYTAACSNVEFLTH